MNKINAISMGPYYAIMQSIIIIPNLQSNLVCDFLSFEGLIPASGTNTNSSDSVFHAIEFFLF